MKRFWIALLALLACTSTAAADAYVIDKKMESKRLVLSPTGSLKFRFTLPASNGIGPSGAGACNPADPAQADVANQGAKSNFQYIMKVTARSPSGATVSNSVCYRLAGKHAPVTVEVPLNVDWAESVVTYSVAELGFNCQKQQFVVKLHEFMPKCIYDHSLDNGPDLSKVKLGYSLPMTFPDNAFLVLVTPAAAFQAPVMPVGILYGPLGNAGSSQFAITLTTASNQGLTATNGTTYANTSDDKDNYTVGMTIGISGENGKVNGGFDQSEGWDTSVESDSADTYGTTQSVVTQNQVGVTFKITAPATTPSLDQIGYSTQPFWLDALLVSINAQYALWTYPSGPVVQPLASADVAVLPIMQLDHCLHTTGAVKPASLTPASWTANRSYAKGTMLVSSDLNHIFVATKGGTSGGTAPGWNTSNGDIVGDGTVVWTNEQDHFIAYAGSVASGATKYVWLSSTDCTNLASLDAFYAAKSQSAHPKSYRLISGGNSLPVSTATTFSNTDQSTQTSGSTGTSQWTTKVTSSEVNGTDATMGEELMSMFGISYKGSSTTTATSASTTMSSQQLQKTQTTSGSAAVSTTIQDSYGGTVPVNVMQDSNFVGLAVQDTNMHFAAPLVAGTDQSAAGAPAGQFGTPRPMPISTTTTAASETDAKAGRSVTDARSPQMSAATLDIPAEYRSLPVVAAATSHAVLRKNGVEPMRYVQRTNYGYVIVSRPSDAERAAIKHAIREMHLAAAKRHVAR